MKEYNDFAADVNCSPRQHPEIHCCECCGKEIAPHALHKSGFVLCFDCEEELKEESA